ncbi:GGDEF domain-containing protein [Zavarzinia compransoris]|uniref:diguanylate cyclase n=1 Tax=Zavarzinia compransoris TaxID=1264899 RepID=A0A317E5G2_9PROT|nr:sensor domain-containing diguanylate cyclase [Zavarzinia compransoris]PWR22378.1 diguanylate cyclase [Zavarzinia compransoris]TDP46853.1 diguanylate cyclase with GAF sensor [Zavarzinia compransoris]
MSIGEAAATERYLRGMERLLRAVQELSLARTVGEVQRIVRTVARELTGADGATFVLNDGSFCHYADEDAIGPLWKGKRFPKEICISGWVMNNRRQVVIPDISVDGRIPQDAYRPTFVKSLAMVPIRAMDPIGAIGNYWAALHEPGPEDMQLLQALADSTSIAMENVGVYAELERRVEDRTRQLAEANREIEALSVTDEMTGLHNRRGFYREAERILNRHHCVLAFIDVDGLKQVNDRLGHAAGDAMLIDVARALRDAFRASDVIARMGGDEFCVLVTDTSVDLAALRAAFEARLEEFNAGAAAPYRLSASIGLIAALPADLDGLDRMIAEADKRMYAEKQAKKAA